MIEWKPIETEPPGGPPGTRLYTNGTRVSDGYALIPSKPTHWAPINLPGEQVRSCDTCNPGAMKLACCGCKNHSKWEGLAERIALMVEKKINDCGGFR